VLLHAERVLGLSAVIVTTLSIGVHTGCGQSRVELSTSGLRYEAEASDRAAAAAAELHQPRLRPRVHEGDAGA
jgi:hypothetical protein